MQKNRVAAISGASRGIGRALAAALSRRGWAVSLCSRNKGEIEAAAQEARGVSVLGSDFVFSKACDLSRFDHAEAWIQETLERLGRIDLLVNNAGILGERLMVQDYPAQLWEEVIRINSMSLFGPTKACLRETMLKQRSGIIVNISSGVGKVGKARWGAYSAAKFGLESFTQVLSAEVKEQGIIVVSLNPEATRTAMRAVAYPQEDPMTLKTPEQFCEKLVPWVDSLNLSHTGRSFDFKDLE